MSPLQVPTPQNGQIHSNNSSATAGELFGVFDHFMGLALKGLRYQNDRKLLYTLK